MKNSIFELIFNKDLSQKVLKDSYRLKQIKNFVLDQNRLSILQFHNLPQKLIKQLDDQFEVISFKELDCLESADGTTKYLFELNDGQKIESVILTDDKERVTFCISTQSGCKMGCQICQTGIMGFYRNLQ